MTTTLLKPDSAPLGRDARHDASIPASFTKNDLAIACDGRHSDTTSARDDISPVRSTLVTQKSVSGSEQVQADPEAETTAGMTEDDTVSVLEVLAEMQRIIDRHLEKTAGQQSES
ncbi:hypothetical protein [Agrobacterium sp. RAC06]|jgi:hypothetical protein|uniref:hypothetical protein n=1 Tax=Agrobacterium sp. RAC06 TaxID=1842536 RepID=UPI000856969A|nr:hypothetical protein [Agrobacterium sp. RAC06]AOG08521.1 hypothetical protein BSY240_1283 [Agrobacterium sp. RAC06]